jgi:hypothetical protein
MKNSTFEEFYKIAAEKDLIDSRESRTKKNNPAEYSKEYIDTIKMLYNIDPTESKGKSITQQAHPEMCIISPAYDKTWGVIENGEEAQALSTAIVFRETNPTTNIRRIAEQELLEELIKAATVLEVQGNKKLTKLADACSQKISNDLEESLKKQAWAWLWPVAKLLGSAAIPYIAGWVMEAPAVAKMKQQAKEHIVQDLLPSIKKAKEALKDSYKESENKKLISGWFSIVKKLEQETNKLAPVLSIQNQKIDKKPETEEDAKELEQKRQATESEKQDLKIYKELCLKIINKFNETKNELEQIQSKEDQEHEGVTGWLKEKWEDVSGDDSQTLLPAMEILITSLENTVKTIEI